MKKNLGLKIARFKIACILFYLSTNYHVILTIIKLMLQDECFSFSVLNNSVKYF